MHDTRRRGSQGPSGGAVGARPHDPSLDDWLGDISDDDWSEHATARAERRNAAPAQQELYEPEGDLSGNGAAGRPAPARPAATAEAHRAVIERRRLVAGLVLVVVLGLAVVTAVLLLRGGGETPVTPVAEPTTATTPPAPRETSPSSASTTRSTSPSTTTPTTPSTPSASGFTLPEGTKLRLREGDPAVIRELQQALTRAGYDPGPADGTFGRRTEAAVVAFQQANDLSADGVVGPDTAAALNSVLAGG